jgi:hypothetical protein
MLWTGEPGSKTAYLKHAEYNGSSWSIKDVTSYGDYGWRGPFLQTSDDHLHVFSQSGSEMETRCSEYDGSIWVTQIIEPGGDSTFSETPFQSSDGHLHIFYRYSQEVKHAEHDGSSWSINTTGFSSYPDFSSFESPDGHLHIFEDTGAEYPDGDVNHAEYDGSSWAKETIDYPGGRLWAVQSGNYFYLSYLSRTTNPTTYHLKHAIGSK